MYYLIDGAVFKYHNMSYYHLSVHLTPETSPWQPGASVVATCAETHTHTMSMLFIRRVCARACFSTSAVWCLFIDTHPRLSCVC